MVPKRCKRTLYFLIYQLYSLSALMALDVPDVSTFDCLIIGCDCLGCDRCNPQPRDLTRPQLKPAFKVQGAWYFYVSNS